jgi:predicted nucleic acid-binding protein
VIVLDTNVLSEPIRPRPDAAVVEWLGGQTDVAVTAVTVGELYLGVRRLPHGRRREGLTGAVDLALAGLSGRVLLYDEHAARIYAELQESRRRAGAPLSVEDGMIAAIVLHHGATLATRNVDDFAGLDVDLINPWQQA